MKVMIDTKEDIHILKHIINLLHAISSNTSGRRFDNDSGYSGSNSMFDSSSSSSSTPETPSGIFNMFDSGSSSSSTPSPSSFSMFDEPKKEEPTKVKDFIDSLQVY